MESRKLKISSNTSLIASFILIQLVINKNIHFNVFKSRQTCECHQIKENREKSNWATVI